MERFGERLRSAESGVYYTLSQTSDFLTQLGKPATHRHKRREYLDLICALDTETTSFVENDVKLGTMYVWMFGCQGSVMIGRTWQQFEQFFHTFCDFFQLGPKRRAIVYVHNLGFDFQFFRKHFEWEEVFAREERSPMYAITTTGLEFRCSYILTNSSLANVGRNLIRYPVQKKLGDLDYRKARHWATPLTDVEIGYCINDVLVVMSLIYDRRAQEKDNIAKIPLTQTGYARRACRQECLYRDENHWKYLRLMHELTLSKDEYLVAKLAFAGGFTHASPMHLDAIGHNLSSYDFTSSYPAVIVAEKYPMGKGEELDPKTITSEEQLTRLGVDFCLLMILEFDHITSKCEQDYYISESKCQAENPEVFNGRVAAADRLIIACTNLDFEIIRQSYNWHRFRVNRIWKYRKAYLPTPYIRTVLNLYKAKTEYKGLPDKVEEYARAKELLNSLYGMMAMLIDRDEITYSSAQEWYTEPNDLDSTLAEYNSNTSRFTSFLWALWVTAAARRNLWTAILTLGGDYWYSDTDSVKCTNAAAYGSYFERYNKIITQKLEKACDYHHMPYDYIRPKTVKGEEKPLGVWDYEGDMPRFKTLGAKRYLYTVPKDGDEELHITVAGVAKRESIAYLTYKYKTLDAIFDAFSDGLVIPGEYEMNGVVYSGTGKSTHMYSDLEFDTDLTDYLGYTAPVHELSSINLSPASYHLGISGMLWEFLKNYWQGVKRL